MLKCNHQITSNRGWKSELGSLCPERALLVHHHLFYQVTQGLFLKAVFQMVGIHPVLENRVIPPQVNTGTLYWASWGSSLPVLSVITCPCEWQHKHPCRVINRPEPTSWSLGLWCCFLPFPLLSGFWTPPSHNHCSQGDRVLYSHCNSHLHTWTAFFLLIRSNRAPLFINSLVTCTKKSSVHPG